jgi:hypothetical protein
MQLNSNLRVCIRACESVFSADYLSFTPTLLTAFRYQIDFSCHTHTHKHERLRVHIHVHYDTRHTEFHSNSKGQRGILMACLNGFQKPVHLHTGWVSTGITAALNKTANASMTQHEDTFTQSQFPWESKKYYIFLCACVRGWVYGCACVWYMVAGACLRQCNLTYAARKKNALYCLLRLWLHRGNRCYLIKGTIFGGGGKLLNIKCVVWFKQKILFKTFLILRRFQRHIVTNAKTP